MSKHASDSLDDIEVSVTEVRSLLRELDPHKAPGPDKIATFILKECADELAIPVTLILRESLRTGNLLKDWKIADVIPIYKKKGDRTRARNYRPVSLTSVLCKVLERMIKKQILNRLEKKLSSEWATWI